MGISDINKRFQANDVIVEYTLFNNNHEEVAIKLRQLMRDIPRTGAKLRLYELPLEQDFTSYPNVAIHEISSTVLHNILNHYEKNY